MVGGNTRKVIVAGAVGNVLEWYDFAIYGYFAVAIGEAFFPKDDEVARVLSAFGIFAVGFLMRPIGGALVGFIGDRLGRKTALTFSVAAMAIPTFLVGVLPGAASLGVAAPILLTLLRMIQGLAVGGEYTTSIVFMVEHAPPGRRGLIGAIGCCGAVGGILLGSATGALLSEILSWQAMSAWGWRIPFILGLLVGLAGFFLRRHLDEGPRPVAVTGGSPLRDTIRLHRGLLLRLAGLSTFNAVGFYLVFVYLVSWLQFVDWVAPDHALGINSISMLVLLPCMIAMGALSDRVGRKPILLAATALAFISAVPLFWLMHHDHDLLIQLGQLGFVLSVGMFLGAQPTLMVEEVPAAIRCTAIALGYNVTLGVIGGLSPLVATWLIKRTADDFIPAYMVMAAAAVSFLSVLAFTERSRAPLEAATTEASS
jgi:MHS family proline/betaine transporter-like MFS transporter